MKKQILITIIGFINIHLLSAQDNIEINKTGDAYIILNADQYGTSTEDNNAYVKFSQDGDAIKAIIGTVGDVNRDPQNNIYNGTLSNSFLIGTLQHSSNYPALQFGTGDNIRMTILPEGNVGIGTSTPSENLEVTDKMLVSGSRNILIDPYVGSIEYHVPATGGWAMGQKFISPTDEFLGGWRAFGGSGVLNYYYVGIDYANPLLAVKPSGNVGIGTTSPDYKLDVEGTIRAHEIKVNLEEGADFVFEEDYNLMPLNELETFVKTQKHLPEVAPAKEMEAEGLSISEMNIKLLQKIEELTLYTIEQQKEIQKLKEEIQNLK